MHETKTDDPLVQAFEAGTLDPAVFHHREHLQVAYCYLSALPLEEALARYVRYLRAFTRRVGAPEKFHTTITWGYLIVLDAAMWRSPGASLEEVLARSPELEGAPGAALSAHYTHDELEAAPARLRFVLPRRT